MYVKILMASFPLDRENADGRFVLQSLVFHIFPTIRLSSLSFVVHLPFSYIWTFYLSVCLSVCLSVHPSIYPPTYLPIYLPTCLSINLSIYRLICLPISLFVCLFIYIYMYYVSLSHMWLNAWSKGYIVSFISAIFFHRLSGYRTHGQSPICQLALLEMVTGHREIDQPSAIYTLSEQWILVVWYIHVTLSCILSVQTNSILKAAWFSFTTVLIMRLHMTLIAN